jgi:hypothetical protein
MQRLFLARPSALSLAALCLAIACGPDTTAPSVDHLDFSVQPTGTTAGTTIAPSVQVTALDLAGDTVTGFTGDVTVVITPGTGTTGATLTGTTTATAANGRLVNGVATFSDLKVSLAGSNYTLTATSGILRSATSAPVTMAPRASTLAHVSAGGLHSCGLTAAGAAYCWGSNSRGQIGDGTTTERLTPVAVSAPAGASFTSMSAGRWKHTCGLTPVGTAYCWGYNCYGQLGDGTRFCPRLTAVAVVMPAAATFTSLAVGYFHTCGLTQAGAAYCGHNGNGEVGDGRRQPGGRLT